MIFQVNFSNCKLNLEKETFVNIAKWMEFVTENKNENCNIVLCGNKLDLERYDV